MMFCICKVIKKSETAKIVKQTKIKITNVTFCETLEKVKEGYILYKTVNPDNCDFFTARIKYEGEVIAPDWDANENRECGGGLHLSPTKEMALSYHQGKILRCAVKTKDFVLFHGNFTKVRCRRILVLGEVE